MNFRGFADDDHLDFRTEVLRNFIEEFGKTVWRLENNRGQLCCCDLLKPCGASSGFDGEVATIDLTDTSQEGTWIFESTTGLSDPAQLKQAAFFEPMMSSIAFSLVMVRTADAVDPKAVAQAMKEGINPRKWICVEADDMLVAGCGDVVMLIMLASEDGMTAQSFVDAFQSVAGRELDFVI